MSLFGQTKRHIPPGPRRSPLPIFTGDNEKFGLSSPTTPTFVGGGSRWYTIVVLPIPHLPFLSRDQPGSGLSNGLGAPRSYYAQPRHTRFVRIPVPIPPKIVARVSRFHPVIKLALAAASLIGLIFLLVGFRSQPSGRSGWSPPFTDPSTLVITPEEAAKIWEWEVLSGHHPSVADGEFWDRHRVANFLQSPPASPSRPASSTPSYRRRCSLLGKRPTSPLLCSRLGFSR